MAPCLRCIDVLITWGGIPNCVIPEGGLEDPPKGTLLRVDVWGCRMGQPHLTFRQLDGGQIQHVTSGKCVQPLGGSQTLQRVQRWSWALNVVTMMPICSFLCRLVGNGGT